MTAGTLTEAVRSLAFVLAVSLVAACSATNTQPSGSTSASAAGSGVVASIGQTTEGPTALTVDTFNGSSLRVVDDDNVAPPPGDGLVVTRAQIVAMVRESQARGGLLGADLDRVASAAAGVVPVSYVIGAWTTVGTSDRARRAAAAIGPRDFHHAPTAQRGSTAVHAVASPISGAGADGPCSAVMDFLDRSLSALFDALRISPSFFGTDGPAGALAGFLAGLWNTAVDFAQGVVKGLVSTLTQPVVDAIRVALGVVGVATTILSYVKNWSLDVRTDPERPDGALYRFAVGGEPDRSGALVATVPPASADWPSALKDCATTAGVALPQLAAPGAPATWTVIYNENVIAPTSALVTNLGQDLTARLDFTTGHESDETARGDQVIGTAVVSVKVPRKEITDFLDLVRVEVLAAEQALLARVPVGPLHDQASAVLSAYVQPAVDQLASAVQDQADGLFSLHGDSVVAVTHHNPPASTTSAGPTTSTADTTAPGAGDFCRRLEDTFAWLQQAVKDATDRLNAAVAAGAERKAMEDANVPLGQGTVERFTALRPLGPASLRGDIDIAIAYGQHLAVFSSGPRDIALQYGPAAARIGSYGRDVCHIDVAKYHIAAP